MVRIATRAAAIGAGLVMTSTACSAASTDSGPSVATIVTTADSTGGGGAPDPAFAWTFDDGGVPEVGDVMLTMAGTWEQADGAASLDGGTGFAATTAPGPLTTTESFTVAVWVSLPAPRLLGQTAFATALSQEGSQAAALYLGAGEEGRWSFAMKDADTSDPGHTIRATAGSLEPDTDRWVHLAGTYDAEAGEIALHVNGVTAAATAFDAPWQADGPFVVGRARSHGSPSDFWPGAVADVRVFDSALDDSAVRDVMDRTRPTTPPPPWPAVEEELSALNGSYEYRMTPEESARLADLFGPEAADAGFPGAAAVVVTFADGLWQQYFSVDDVPYLVGGRTEGDGGTYRVDGNDLVLNGSGRYTWSLADDVLSLTLTDQPPDADVVRFVTERDFARVAG